MGLRRDRIPSRPARDRCQCAWLPRARAGARNLRADPRAHRLARNQLAQGITGIPYYYRLFGYEYALNLAGSRSVYFAAIPQLKPDQPEPFALRDATLADLPQVRALYERERRRGPVSARIGEPYWRWLLEGQNIASGEGWRTQLIVDGAGATLGYVLTSAPALG